MHRQLLVLGSRFDELKNIAGGGRFGNHWADGFTDDGSGSILEHSKPTVLKFSSPLLQNQTVLFKEALAAARSEMKNPTSIFPDTPFENMFDEETRRGLVDGDSVIKLMAVTKTEYLICLAFTNKQSAASTWKGKDEEEFRKRLKRLCREVAAGVKEPWEQKIHQALVVQIQKTMVGEVEKPEEPEAAASEVTKPEAAASKVEKPEESKEKKKDKKDKKDKETKDSKTEKTDTADKTKKDRDSNKGKKDKRDEKDDKKDSKKSRTGEV